jgi:hypothetical protein
MTGKRFLLAAMLSLIVCPSLMAQPEIVNIQLQPGTPRTITVTPNATVVCRNNPSCPTELSFRWIGPEGADTTERLSVFYKNGLYWEGDVPSQIPPQDCFEFPGDENPFVLMHGPANARHLVFKQAATECKDKVAFFFEISCQNAAGNNCGGIVTLDPGTMVDNGRR